MTDWDRIGFVLGGLPRFRVMVELRRGPTTPKTLSGRLEAPISHISLALKELGDRGWVECLNPQARKGRKYAITADGMKILDEVARLARPGRA